MPKPIAGYVSGKLYLALNGADNQILLGDMSLPITVTDSSDYATYKLGVDLASVTESVREIFRQAEETDHA